MGAQSWLPVYRLLSSTVSLLMYKLGGCLSVDLQSRKLFLCKLATLFMKEYPLHFNHAFAVEHSMGPSHHGPCR